MKSYTSKEIRNVVMLGHSGSGKTTITESCLFKSGATKRFGKVDDGNTVSDYDPEEIKRHVSINSSILPVEWKDTKINFIDTPGYFDFAGEVMLSTKVADAAIIVVSGKAGVEVGTEKAWEYVEKFETPRMFFMNFMDDEHADYSRVLGELRDHFGKSVAPVQIPFYDGEKIRGFIDVITRETKYLDASRTGFEPGSFPEEMRDEVESLRQMIIEVAAESIDELLEKYFADEELTIEEIYEGLNVGVKERKIAPLFTGAANYGLGIMLLMNSIKNFLPPSVECKPEFECTDLNTGEMVIRKNDEGDHFAAYVFKTISDPYIGRLNIFRVLSGKLTKDKVIYNPEKDTQEKVAHIYVIRGKEQIEVDELEAGDIGALAKLQNTATQDTLCSSVNPVQVSKIELPTSVYSRAIVPKAKGDDDKIAAALVKLREEDPTIKVEINKETKQTILYGVGDQQLDVLVCKLKNKYKTDVDLVDVIIPYRETIKSKVKVQGKYKKQSGGHGQFGDIWMEFEPSGDMSKPYVFEEKIFGGSVPKQYFPAVEKGLQECVNTGVLAGYPVVGLKATLVDGSYHPVDSSEMAFKMATSLAFKDGTAKAKPTILEPIAHMEVVIPEKYMGDIMGDINKRRGRILSMDGIDGGKKCIVAEVPLSEISKYSIDLRSMTQGRGSYSYNFERYEEAPADVQQKVIAARAK